MPLLRYVIHCSVLAAIRFNQRVIGIDSVLEALQYVIQAVIPVRVPLQSGKFNVKGYRRIVQRKRDHHLQLFGALVDQAHPGIGFAVLR